MDFRKYHNVQISFNLFCENFTYVIWKYTQTIKYSFSYLQKKWRFYITKKQVEDEEETNKRVLTRWERDYNLGKS